MSWVDEIREIKKLNEKILEELKRLNRYNMIEMQYTKLKNKQSKIGKNK